MEQELQTTARARREAVSDRSLAFAALSRTAVVTFPKIQHLDRGEAKTIEMELPQRQPNAAVRVSLYIHVPAPFLPQRPCSQACDQWQLVCPVLENRSRFPRKSTKQMWKWPSKMGRPRLGVVLQVEPDPMGHETPRTLKSHSQTPRNLTHPALTPTAVSTASAATVTPATTTTTPTTNMASERRARKENQTERSNHIQMKYC